MLQNNYLASEPHYICDDCSQAITNPLCPMCLTTEIEAWLTLYPNLRSEILPKLQGYLKKIEDKIDESTKCIKCKNKIASVCPHCFTKHVLNELNKINANNIILNEFTTFFSFNGLVPSPHAKKWGYKQVI